MAQALLKAYIADLVIDKSRMFIRLRTQHRFLIPRDTFFGHLRDHAGLSRRVKYSRLRIYEKAAPEV